MNFYDSLEPEVRDIVKQLRDRGWNTFCSCGHDMTVDVDIQNGDEAEQFCRDLVDLGISEFRVTILIQNPGQGLWKRSIHAELRPVTPQPRAT